MITQIHVDGLPDRDALAALLYEHWLKKHPRACSRVDPQGNFHVLNWWDVDWDYHLKGPYYLDDTTTVADFASALYQGQFDESGKHRVCRERDEFRAVAPPATSTSPSSMPRNFPSYELPKSPTQTAESFAAAYCELDRNQPPWQAWMLRGRPGTPFAAREDLLEKKYNKVNVLIFRVHHALADGLRIALAGSTGFVTNMDGTPADFGRFIEQQKIKVLIKQGYLPADYGKMPEPEQSEIVEEDAAGQEQEAVDAPTTQAAQEERRGTPAAPPSTGVTTASGTKPTAAQVKAKAFSTALGVLVRQPAILLKYCLKGLCLGLNALYSTAHLTRHMFLLPKQTENAFSGQNDHMCEGLTERQFLYFPTLDLEMVKLVKNVLSRPRDGRGRCPRDGAGAEGVAEEELREGQRTEGTRKADVEMEDAETQEPASSSTETFAAAAAPPAPTGGGSAPDAEDELTAGMRSMNLGASTSASSSSPTATVADYLRFFYNFLMGTSSANASSGSAGAKAKGPPSPLYTVNDVLQSCLFGAVARYLDDVSSDPGREVVLRSATFMGFPDMTIPPVKEPEQNRAGCGRNSPATSSSSTPTTPLYNDWITCLGSPMPLNQPKKPHRFFSPLERLALTKRDGDWYKRNLYPLVLRFLLRNVLWLLGERANREVLRQCFSRHTLLLSNVPGYNEGPIKLLGKSVLGIYVPMPQVTNYAMILTYDNKVFTTMAVNPRVTKKPDSLMSFFLDEFKALVVEAAHHPAIAEEEKDKLLQWLLDNDEEGGL
eukprot:g7310.t1